MREISIFTAPADKWLVVAHDSETGRSAFAHAADENTNDFLELSRIAVNRLAAMIEIDGEKRMTPINDDPIISRIERTGYAHDYEPQEDPYWESPDGDTVSRENFAEAVKQYALDDPHWVADCLGFVWKEGRC